MRSNPYGITPDCKVCRKVRQRQYNEDKKMDQFIQDLDLKYGNPPTDDED